LTDDDTMTKADIWTTPMGDDGLDAVKTKDGQFRFRYTTRGGAEHWGPSLHKTAAAAKRAGRKWLEVRAVLTGIRPK
jgi:hypothetical protein